MENAIYATLTRQSGLIREMQIVANNIANVSTTGYRAEGVVFSEFIRRTGGDASLSMATARGQMTSLQQGGLRQTGGPLDFAIEGEGFFLVEAPDGERLTRAGAFALSPDGSLVTPDGLRVLDAGGAPILLPPGGDDVKLGADGTMSVDGRPVAQLGIVRPLDPLALRREGAMLFDPGDGVEPVENPRVVQGFVESSNVNPVSELARMISVQRAYEMGQSFLDAEDERIRNALKTLTR